jgi:hypothetical protein
VNCWSWAEVNLPLLTAAVSSVFSCESMSPDWPIRTNASAWETTPALLCWRIAAFSTP